MASYASSVEDRLQELADEYEDAIDEVVADARTEVLIPFCDRRKLTFTAGLGVWFFNDQLGARITDFDLVLMHGTKKLLEVLTVTLPSGYSLGSAMEDYRPEGFKEKL